MILQGVLVALVYLICNDLVKSGGWLAMYRPICMAPLVGLVLGDAKTGLIMGASLEGIFMGFQSMGGSIPPDFQTATCISVAYTILTGSSMAEGIALSMPVATLGSTITSLLSPVWCALVPHWEKLAASCSPKKFFIQNALVTYLLQPAVMTIVIFMAISFGIDGLSNLMNSLPSWISRGLNASTTMLTGVGYAILMTMIWDVQVLPWFFVGLVLVSYLGLDSLPIAIIGAAIALTVFFIEKNRIDGENKLKASKTDTNDNLVTSKEDFF